MYMNTSQKLRTQSPTSPNKSWSTRLANDPHNPTVYVCCGCKKIDPTAHLLQKWFAHVACSVSVTWTHWSRQYKEPPQVLQSFLFWDRVWGLFTFWALPFIQTTHEIDCTMPMACDLLVYMLSTLWEALASLHPHLIQQNDSRFLQDRSSNCHSLLLPTAELQTSFPYLCVIPWLDTMPSSLLLSSLLPLLYLDFTTEFKTGLVTGSLP